ncbi:hypothetical protein [uncultured Paraglaciecola sp.]|uniref:hypothetical protein n=1 Tax=uncultured Paraglaciecola sp. TaxID=1765024 RepID=UPI0026224055|nr:hypothetical protein [uncultured Paraglaciecola sp.]
MATQITAVITGTVLSTINEADIVAGGQTIIITLTGDTWLAAGTGPIGTTAQTNAILAGIDSAQLEGTGWDAEVKANFTSTDLVRTSATVATVTLGAEASYDITATETITVTIPSAALVNSLIDVIATPTFTIDDGGCAGVMVGTYLGTSAFNTSNRSYTRYNWISATPTDLSSSTGIFCTDNSGSILNVDLSDLLFEFTNTGGGSVLFAFYNNTGGSSIIERIDNSDFYFQLEPDFDAISLTFPTGSTAPLHPNQDLYLHTL